MRVVRVTRVLQLQKGFSIYVLPRARTVTDLRAAGLPLMHW
jgi:hypothetical protein